MRQRTTILVQNETLGAYQLRPGKRPVVIGSADDADLQLTRGHVRQRHAGLWWRDGRWELFDLDGKDGIYYDEQRFAQLDLTEPRTVRFGGPHGAVVSLTPLPRPAPRWPRWMLIVGVIVLCALLVLVAGFYIAPERTAGHQPYAIGTCVETDAPWSAGREDVRPPGDRTDCEGRFDYKVLSVIPVPTPQLTALSIGRYLRKRALELTQGQCPPASWPALGRPDKGNITHEVYCVQDSIYTIDAEVAKQNRDLGCVLRDDGKPRLVTACSLRHDYVIEDFVPLDKTPYPGKEGMEQIGQDACPDATPFVPTEQAWRQGYRNQLLCLTTDNFTYDEVIDWAVKDLRSYWDQHLPDAASKPSTVEVKAEKDYNPKSPPVCYQGPLVDNARYCPRDDSVAWDPQWLHSSFYDQYGDIAVAVVLAHEWGHVIQNRLGLDDPDRLKRFSEKERTRDNVLQEHQADCYAGAWLWHYFKDDLGFTPADDDRNKAVHAIVEVADSGTSADERFEKGAHGDALQRMQNLLRGFDEQGRDACRELVPDDRRTSLR
jgi:predicted metalloprotease